jgi:ribosome biogenesis protein BMS1
VTNLMFPPEEKGKWKGMKTVGEIKREKNLAVMPNPDNLYRKVDRVPKMFKPLQIPRNLQKALPYSLKPKLAKAGRDIDSERVNIELDSKEKKVRKLMEMLTEVAEDKAGKLEAEKKKRVGTLIARQEVEETRKMRYEKAARQRVARAMSQDRAKKERMAGKGRGKKRKAGADD